MIFGCDNKANSVLVLRREDVEIGKTRIRAEQSLSKNLTVDNKKFVLSLHYNKDNSYLFVNREEIVKLLNQKTQKLFHIPFVLVIFHQTTQVENHLKQECQDIFIMQS